MSTLHVENLKGLSSGSNANKIIVPSGQTLDASNGLTPPSGYVIQAVTATYGGTSTNSASYVAMSTVGSITTTVANSKLLVTAAAQCQAGRSSSSDTKAAFALRSSVDSYASNLHTQAIVNYRESQNGWQQGNMPFHILHSPNASAGTTITYKIYAKRDSGPHNVYLIDAWGLGGEGKTTILEITP
jgi:hypothetical protein